MKWGFFSVTHIVTLVLAAGAIFALHLCSLNALVLPMAVFTRNKTLGNLLLVYAPELIRYFKNKKCVTP